MTPLLDYRRCSRQYLEQEQRGQQSCGAVAGDRVPSILCRDPFSPPWGDSVPSYRMLQFLSSGTRRRGDIKKLAQPTILIHDLDDVVGSARLRVKLYAGQVLDTFGVGAISNMP